MYDKRIEMYILYPSISFKNSISINAMAKQPMAATSKTNINIAINI